MGDLATSISVICKSDKHCEVDKSIVLYIMINLLSMFILDFGNCYTSELIHTYKYI